MEQFLLSRDNLSFMITTFKYVLLFVVVLSIYSYDKFYVFAIM